MTTTRTSLVDRIWAGKDPFSAAPRGLFKPVPQGWNSHHVYFEEAIDKLKPKIIVEVGVWKGVSTMHMAHLLHRNNIDGVVIAVDTWLGASDHWTSSDWFPSLLIENGQPRLMQTFIANVVESGLQQFIVPLPLDSVNASEVLKHYGVGIDMIHIDAGHEYGSVMADLQAWWPLLKVGGCLIGDDYYVDGGWPGLRAAFDEFFGSLGVAASLENTTAKCRIMKSPPGSSPVDASRGA